MEEEARPIMATSIALALGFATLGLSDFPPVRHFGLLSALVIMLALFANFVTTPLLLSYVRLVTVWDLLAVRLKSHIVNRCPLFKDMSMWEVRKIVLVSQPIRYHAGSKIFAQGESGKEMFVILDGEVEMEHREENGDICVIDKLHAGQVFGATALAADVPRPVTVVANKDSELLALKWSSLRRIGRLFPYLSSKLYRNVSAIIGKRLAGELEAINQREEHCGKSAHALEETELSDEESFIKI
jgi:CRP-like cAMP-binding protein